MATATVGKQALTLERLIKLLDPGRVFYRPAVHDVLKRGELAEIEAMIKGVRDAKAKFGDFDGVINKLETAAKKVRREVDVRQADALPVRYAGLDDIINRVPVSVVWEITLACDLACSTAAPAPAAGDGRAHHRRGVRLVDQIAELGARRSA